MTLADIIREKEAVALLCPVCRRWHPIRAKLTDITEKNDARIYCDPLGRTEKWSGAISLQEGNEKESDDPFYRIFHDRIERTVSYHGARYSFYIKENEFYWNFDDDFPIPTRNKCHAKKNSISLNDLDKNLFFVDVKPCRGDYRYSATMEILFLLKCQWPCENCNESRLSDDLICEYYFDALKRYLSGQQKTENFEKTFVLGFRYNLTEDEIKGFPSYYNLLELRRNADSHELERRVYSNIRRLEKLIGMEQIAEFDGYEDKIKKEEELIKRLKSLLKEEEAIKPDEKFRKQCADFCECIVMGMFKGEISYNQAKKEISSMAHNRLKKLEDIFSVADSDRVKIETKIDEIEREMSDFINKFEKSLLNRRRQLEGD